MGPFEDRSRLALQVLCIDLLLMMLLLLLM
jgi:hypothetical protein